MDLTTGAPSPYQTTIAWSRFFVEIDGRRGISLRRLVEEGKLYERMHGAVQALKASGIPCSQARVKSRGGRPSEDYLLELDDAIEFCARAQTDVGRAMMRLLISHHNEFQKLLAGDPEALRQLADAAAPSSRTLGSAREERLRLQALQRPLLEGARAARSRGDYDTAQSLALQAAQLSGVAVAACHFPYADDRPIYTSAEVASRASTSDDRVTFQKVGAVAAALGIRNDPRFCREVNLQSADGHMQVCPLYTRRAVERIVAEIRAQRKSGAQLTIIDGGGGAS